MRDLPQMSHCDLGLIDDDTEDLRDIPRSGFSEVRNIRTAPEPQVRQHPAGTAHTHSPVEEKG